MLNNWELGYLYFFWIFLLVTLLDSDTFRIPLFCLVDLDREDIQGAIDDLRRFERMLLPQSQFIVNFTGFGRSKLRGR